MEFIHDMLGKEIPELEQNVKKMLGLATCESF